MPLLKEFKIKQTNDVNVQMVTFIAQMGAASIL